MVTRNRFTGVLRARMLPAYFAITSCTPMSAGEGSESHFACRLPADCEPLGSAFTCKDQICVADAETGALLEAGVCFGKNTHCEPIEFASFDFSAFACGTATCSPEGYLACDPNAGDEVELTPEWLVELDTVSCPAPGCLERAQDLAPGENGELWVNAQVWTPSAEDPNGADWVGASLVHLDASGQTIGAPTTIFESRLSNTMPTIHGIQLGPNHDVFRAAPSPSFGSVDVQHYETSGQKIAAYDTAATVAYQANAVWGEDGSATIVYHHRKDEMASTDGGSTSVPRLPLNVARFDSSGRLLWNQTGLESIDAETSSVEENLQISVDAGGNTTIVVPVAIDPVDALTYSLRVVKLDNEGNLVWARSMPGGYYFTGTGAQVSSNGDLVLVHDTPVAGPVETEWVIDEIAPGGRPMFRWLQVYLKDELHPVVDGRRLLQGVRSSIDSMTYQVMDLDSNTCQNFVIPIGACPEVTGRSGCPTRTMASKDGAFYFSLGTRVGRVTLP